LIVVMILKGLHALFNQYLWRIRLRGILGLEQTRKNKNSQNSTEQCEKFVGPQCRILQVFGTFSLSRFKTISRFTTYS
jgi:hypothetical protein